MKKNQIMYLVSLPILILAFGLYMTTIMPKASTLTPTTHDFSLDAYTTVQVLRADGTSFYVIKDKHNLFLNGGKDAVLDLLAGRVTPNTGLLSNFTQIALCNDTGSFAGSQPTVCSQTYYDSGLVNATGTVTRITNGNWSVVATFTSTVANKDINATALYNSSCGAGVGCVAFAGNNFTKVTLANSDQITITWNISVA